MVLFVCLMFPCSCIQYWSLLKMINAGDKDSRCLENITAGLYKHLYNQNCNITWNCTNTQFFTRLDYIGFGWNRVENITSRLQKHFDNQSFFRLVEIRIYCISLTDEDPMRSLAQYNPTPNIWSRMEIEGLPYPCD